MSKALFLAAFVLAFGAAALQAQDAGKKFNLRYYGVVTNVHDQNMLNITQDLFYAQLRGINWLDAQDLRDDEIKESYAQIQTDENCEAFFDLAQGQEPQENTLLFVARIFRPRSDEKWSCAFVAKNMESGQIFSKSKEYDSYYKILTDAKLLIQAVMADASGNAGADALAAKKAPAAGGGEAVEGGAESLAGTWGGEKSASKIILLRSGRGFIIFNNGATMNVSVSLKDGGSAVQIVQRDKFNASFYPEIDRQTILNYSESASPIEWLFTLSSDGSLVGKKKTLVQSGGTVEPASVDVVWTKK